MLIFHIVLVSLRAAVKYPAFFIFFLVVSNKCCIFVMETKHKHYGKEI